MSNATLWRSLALQGAQALRTFSRASAQTHLASAMPRASTLLISSHPSSTPFPRGLGHSRCRGLAIGSRHQHSSVAADDTGAKSETPRTRSPDVLRPGNPYWWIDDEAEDLIARAYQRHRALANKGTSFPPSLSVENLERIGEAQHYPPRDLTDRAAYGTMRFLRRFVHAFFRERYDHHAVTLETVAAIPGQVAAFYRHLRSLRNMERDHGWINPLLEEAENERMHLLIWLKVTQPTRLERSIVVCAQLGYMLAYSTLYVVHPRMAHRLTGYLEEEAHSAYTDFLNAIDDGRIKNRPAPQIAIDYYRLPSSADLRDVVLHVRADESAHREYNHMLGDQYGSGKVSEPPSFMSYKMTPADIAKDRLNKIK